MYSPIAVKAVAVGINLVKWLINSSWMSSFEPDLHTNIYANHTEISF